MFPLWARLLLLCMMVSFVFHMYVAPDGSHPYNSVVADVVNGSLSTGLTTQIAALLLIAGVGAIAGTVLFPNPFSIFGVFCLTFLAGLVLVPQNLINSSSIPGGLPEEIRLLLFGTFSFMYLVAVVLFFKGSD